jgi:peptidoglycan/LPS O-acetylase OafA/YrhL
MTAPTPARLEHQPALDGLRGAAVVGVLLYHGGYMTGGYLGVDAFFVLSGFLITSLLIVEHGNHGTISLGAFWARRARRLLPALFGVLIAVALYAAFVAHADELNGIRGDAIATLAYFANWRAILAGGDYFSIFRSPSPLQHTWSLAIEEQFYFVWPVVVLGLVRGCVARRAQQRILCASLALAALSIAIAQVLYSPTDPSRVYYGTDTRASSVLIGAALATLLALFGPIGARAARRGLEVAGCLAMLWLGYQWLTLAGQSRFLYRGGLVACAIAVAIVIAAATNPVRGPSFFVLSFPPLRALGIISYGLYLWHWPIYVYLSEDRTGLAGLQLLAVRLGATLAVALLSYRFIEQPIRRQQLPTRVVWIATPVAVGVLVLALIVTTTNDALPVHGRFATKSVPVPGTPEWTAKVADFRTFAAHSATATRVLVAGDSVAESLGTNASDAAHRTSSLPFGLIGCSLLDDADLVINGYAQPLNPNCHGWERLSADVVTAFDPDVVVVMLGPWEMFDRQVRGERINAGSEHLAELLTKQLDLQRRIVTYRGAKELVLSAPCFTPPHEDGTADDVWRDPDRRVWLNGVLRKFAAAHRRDVSLANFGGFVCPNGQPRVATNGRPLRTDGIHFSAAGAATVWPWISSRVVGLRARGSLRHR